MRNSQNWKVYKKIRTLQLSYVIKSCNSSDFSLEKEPQVLKKRNTKKLAINIYYSCLCANLDSYLLNWKETYLPKKLRLAFKWKVATTFCIARWGPVEA